MTSKQPHGRSEWGNLSIQQRIKAMNQNTETEEECITSGSDHKRSVMAQQTSSVVSTHQQHISAKNEEQSNPADSNRPKRSSVVDMWKKKEGSFSNRFNRNNQDPTTPKATQQKSSKSFFQDPHVPSSPLAQSSQSVVLTSKDEEEKKEQSSDTEGNDVNLRRVNSWKKPENDKLPLSTSAASPSPSPRTNGPVDLTLLPTSRQSVSTPRRNSSPRISGSAVVDMSDYSPRTRGASPRSPMAIRRGRTSSLPTERRSFSQERRERPRLSSSSYGDDKRNSDIGLADSVDLTNISHPEEASINNDEPARLMQTPTWSKRGQIGTNLAVATLDVKKEEESFQPEKQKEAVTSSRKRNSVVDIWTKRSAAQAQSPSAAVSSSAALDDNNVRSKPPLPTTKQVVAYPDAGFNDSTPAESQNRISSPSISKAELPRHLYIETSAGQVDEVLSKNSPRTAVVRSRWSPRSDGVKSEISSPRSRPMPKPQGSPYSKNTGTMSRDNHEDSHYGNGKVGQSNDRMYAGFETPNSSATRGDDTDKEYVFRRASFSTEKPSVVSTNSFGSSHSDRPESVSSAGVSVTRGNALDRWKKASKTSQGDDGSLPQQYNTNQDKESSTHSTASAIIARWSRKIEGDDDSDRECGDNNYSTHSARTFATSYASNHSRSTISSRPSVVERWTKRSGDTRQTSHHIIPSASNSDYSPQPTITTNHDIKSDTRKANTLPINTPKQETNVAVSTSKAANRSNTQEPKSKPKPLIIDRQQNDSDIIYSQKTRPSKPGIDVSNTSCNIDDARTDTNKSDVVTTDETVVKVEELNIASRTKQSASPRNSYYRDRRLKRVEAKLSPRRNSNLRPNSFEKLSNSKVNPSSTEFEPNQKLSENDDVKFTPETPVPDVSPFEQERKYSLGLAHSAGNKPNMSHSKSSAFKSWQNESPSPSSDADSAGKKKDLKKMGQKHASRIHIPKLSSHGGSDDGVYDDGMVPESVPAPAPAPSPSPSRASKILSEKRSKMLSGNSKMVPMKMGSNHPTRQGKSEKVSNHHHKHGMDNRNFQENAGNLKTKPSESTASSAIHSKNIQRYFPPANRPNPALDVKNSSKPIPTPQRHKVGRNVPGSDIDEYTFDSEALSQEFSEIVDNRRHTSSNAAARKYAGTKPNSSVTHAKIPKPSLPVQTILSCGSEPNEMFGHSFERTEPRSPETHSEYASLCVSDSDSFLVSEMGHDNAVDRVLRIGESQDTSSINAVPSLPDSTAAVKASSVMSENTGSAASSTIYPATKSSSTLADRAGRLLRGKRMLRTTKRYDGSPSTEIVDESNNATIDHSEEIDTNIVTNSTVTTTSSADANDDDGNSTRPDDTTRTRDVTTAASGSEKSNDTTTVSASSDADVAELLSGTRYGDSSRFLDVAENGHSVAGYSTSIGGNSHSVLTYPSGTTYTTASASTHYSRRAPSFESETTGTNTNSASVTESDTYHGSRSMTSHTRTQRDGRSVASGSVVSKDIVTEEFVSESSANVEAFRDAYQSFSLEQIARDMKEEVTTSITNGLNLQKLATDWNQGMTAASESINKLVGVTKGAGLKTPRVGSPIEEAIAIEVEYIEEYDDADDLD